MALIKCPSCKNIVSNESYCCPRCGKSFRVMRFKRVLLGLIVLGAGAWATWHYVFHEQFTWRW